MLSPVMAVTALMGIVDYRSRIERAENHVNSAEAGESGKEFTAVERIGATVQRHLVI